MKNYEATKTDIFQLWIEKNIKECIMTFSCGGDSMNDTSFLLYDNEGKNVFEPIITDYLEEDVYHKVEFYEVSDGHYMGESGTVTITLEKYEDYLITDTDTLENSNNFYFVRKDSYHKKC